MIIESRISVRQITIARHDIGTDFKFGDALNSDVCHMLMQTYFRLCKGAETKFNK